MSYRIPKLLFNICIFICGLHGYSQAASIFGKVSNKSIPLEFADIFLQGTRYGVTSDANGNYRINNIPAGTYTVIASSLGYQKQVRQITLGTHQQLVLNFEMTEDSASLDEVVISGTMKEVSKLESPVPVEVYSAKFFKANPTPSIFESLQNINGVRPQINCNICNTGDIHINGLEGPYTMILIDGMPIVSGLSTVYGLTGIPQSLIERIEIVKGPASTLYGSEAVGGLINIITKKPSTAPILSIDLFASDWKELNTDIGVKYRLGTKVDALLGVNYFNYSNPIDKNKDGFTDVTLQDRISIFNKFNFQRNHDRIFSIAARYLYEDRWGGEMNWTPEYRGGDEIYGESIYTSRWEAYGIYQLPTQELLNFQFSANGHKQNSVYGDTEYLANQLIGFGQLTWNKVLNKHDLLLGLTYRYNAYDDNTPATASGDDQNSSNSPSITHLPGFFIQDEIQLNYNNKLLLGVRYDYNSIHGSILSPRLNFKWTSNDKNSVLRFSAGNGYRVANVFTEDHAALTGARTVEFEGALKPETSWNGNINYVQKFLSKNGNYIGLDASAFYTYFTNQILPDYETDPNKIIYGNLKGSSVSKGISLNLDMTFNNGITLNTGATLMDVSVNENGMKYRQILTERFQGVWSLGYTFIQSGISLDYTGNLYGPMRLPLLGELDDRPEYSPWWSIQNIQITKNFGSWELYGGVKNLLNFTPPANSIARSFDPFDRDVVFDNNGQVVPTPDNPNALTFDPSYVYAPNQGIRGFLGIRYTLL